MTLNVLYEGPDLAVPEGGPAPAVPRDDGQVVGDDEGPDDRLPVALAAAGRHARHRVACGRQFKIEE